MAIWQEVDWEKTCEEALGYFKDLIRFKTVNPPGDEKPAAEFLADILKKEGLEPELFESAPCRANMVCRIKGSGEKEPVLLNGHLDVVAVEEEKWTVPPFDAVEKDGFLYGRGAVDMKNMVTMSLMCMLLLKRAGAIPKRDVIFAAVADEESGCDHGSRFLVENHPDKVKAEYGLGEMGGFSMDMQGTRFYLIQVAEKSMCWLKVITEGEPGHGSIPDSESALVKLSEIASKLGTAGLPQHNVEAVTRFVEGVCGSLSFPKDKVFRMLLNPRLSPTLLNKVMPDKGSAQAFSAMLRNTANPTVMRAGEKTNVIPSRAELEVDGRVLPGFTKDDFIKEIRELIGEEARIEVIRHTKGNQAPADDPIMELFTEVLTRRDPAAVVVPNLMTGFTDASQWSRLGIKCYGFSPVKLPPDVSFKNLAHGHDERIPLEGFRFGLETLFEVVEKLVK